MNERIKRLLMMDYANNKNNNTTTGLLDNRNQGGLFGNLANINPNILIGSQIIGAGLKGSDPFSPIMPSVLQAAKIKQALNPKGKLIKAKNKTTGQKGFVDSNVIRANPDNFDIIETKMFEDTESKKIGEVYGNNFKDINAAANTAVSQNDTLNLLSELMKLPDLKTGEFGNLRNTVEKTLNEFGIDLDLQNASAADVVNSIQGKLVLDGLANFKGAISDKEREFLQNIYPGLSLTKRGNEVLITLNKKLNDRTIALNTSMNNWRESYGKLSSRNPDGQDFLQWKSEWIKNNPIVTEEDRTLISSLEGQVDDNFSFAQGTLIDDKIIEQFPSMKKYKGSRYIIVGGKVKIISN